MSVIGQARATLDGVTPAPWVVREDDFSDTITVGSGSYLESPGAYVSTDLIVEHDLIDDPDDVLDPQLHDNQRRADARFIAASRTLVPALVRELEAAREVSEARLALIEQLKAELRQAKAEVRRLANDHSAPRPRYCIQCGMGGLVGIHRCGRNR